MLQNTSVTKILDVSPTDLFSGTVTVLRTKIELDYEDCTLTEHLMSSEALEDYEQIGPLSEAILTDFTLIREAMDANECSYFRLITS